MKRPALKRPILAALLLLLASCTFSNLPDISPSPLVPEAAPAPPAPNAALAKIADDMWKVRLDEDISLRTKFGLPIETLPDAGFEKAKQDAARAQTILSRLRAIDLASLNEEDRITYGTIQWNAGIEADGLRWFWHRFPVTPYATPIRPVVAAFMAYAFKSGDDTERYLRLIDASPAFFDGIAAVVR